jgi:uncharacterized membrane protein YfcA
MLGASLTLQVLGVVWLGAFAGALAFALTASAIWLHALEPLHTTMLVVACGTLLHTTLVWPMRHSIELKRLWPFAIGGLIGIPIGVSLLTHTDVSKVKVVVGIFLVVYGLYAVLTPRLPTINGGGRSSDAVVGFLGGVLGGLGGFSGVLPTIWTQLRGWPKGTSRGVYQPFILLAHLVTLLLLGATALDLTGFLLVAASLPALFAGAWLGLKIYGRLDERLFRRVLSILLLLSGVMLLV